VVAQPAASASQQVAESELSSVRVAVADIDLLLDGVLGAQVALEALAEHATRALRDGEQATQGVRRELAASGAQSDSLEALGVGLRRAAEEATAAASSNSCARRWLRYDCCRCPRSSPISNARCAMRLSSTARR
jgi:hypothetical protein